MWDPVTDTSFRNVFQKLQVIFNLERTMELAAVITFLNGVKGGVAGGAAAAMCLQPLVGKRVQQHVLYFNSIF